MLKRKKVQYILVFFVAAIEQLWIRINCQHFHIHNELPAYLFCKNSLIIPDWCWWDINTRMAIDICLYHIGRDTNVVIILAITPMPHSVWSCHLNVVLIGDISNPKTHQWRLTSLHKYTDISKQCHFLKCIFEGI